MHQTATAFLDDIRANPESDDFRLIFADWLDDHGESAWAEFIRVQVELASLEAIQHDCGENGEWETTCPACGCASYLGELREREERLFFTLDSRGEVGLPREVLGGQCDCNQAGTLVEYHDTSATRWTFSWSRGFLSSVRCTCADWLEYGKVLAQHPLEVVVLTDKKPERVLGSRDNVFFRWYREGTLTDRPDFLPWKLWTVIHEERNAAVGHYAWDTEQDALDALSRGCILWARGQS